MVSCMDDIISTMELMETAYSALKEIDPEHELLKYWTPEEGNWVPNRKEGVWNEFVERFTPEEYKVLGKDPRIIHLLCMYVVDLEVAAGIRELVIR